MSAVANLHRSLDPQTLRRTLEAHRRYLASRTGGQRANLAYTDLSGFRLEGHDLRDADLTGVKLGGAALAGIKLERAILFGADLRDTDMRRADLSHADLRGASLRGANLTGANLSNCDLREGRIALQDRDEGFRYLDHAGGAGELIFAVLAGATLSGAQMTGV